MDGAVDAKIRRMGLAAGWATTGLIAVYVSVLAIGLGTLPSPDAQIADPWFTAMELLILAMMPTIVLLMVAIHALAASAVRHWTLAAVVFTGLLAGLTSVVHFPILTLSHTGVFDTEWSALVFAFRWPSMAYALDILAWDVFFPLAVLCAVPAFGGHGRDRVIRWALILSAALAIAGLVGIPTADMNLRNIGIVGYACVFPVATALIALRFQRRAAA